MHNGRARFAWFVWVFVALAIVSFAAATPQSSKVVYSAAPDAVGLVDLGVETPLEGSRAGGVSPLDASLAVVIAANVSAADPGDLIALNGSVTNDGSEAALNIVLEATVDANASYVSSLPIGSYNQTARTLRWTIASVAVGARSDVAWTVRVVPGTPNLATVASRLRATYENASGVPRPPEESAATVVIQSPAFQPVLRLDRFAAERGEEVVASLYANNTGAGTAKRAWSNWSLAGHYALVSVTPAGPVMNVSDGFHVAWTDVAPGPHSVVARLRVIRAVPDGLSMPLQVQWASTDANGNPLAPQVVGGSIDLLAPSVSIEVTSAVPKVTTSTPFTISVAISNTGRATATGWLNVTLPGGATYVGINASYAVSSIGKRYTWTVPAIPAGSAVSVAITFNAGQDPKPDAEFVFAFAYSDGQAGPAIGSADDRVRVEFASPVEVPFLWIAVAAATVGASLAGFVWWRRASDVSVEDVYIAHRSGALLAHRSTGLVPYEDEDVLVGMFKVVQDFIKDSFAKGTGEEVQSLEFGERKIMIERGRHHFMAVVYSGRDRGTLLTRVRKISELIDTRYGDLIENWTGDLDDVRGIARLLPGVWKPRRSPRQRRSGFGAPRGVRATRVPASSDPVRGAARSETSVVPSGDNPPFPARDEEP